MISCRRKEKKMEAFVELAGKQVKVKEGMELSVLRIKDKKAGDKIKLTPLCCVDGNDIIVDKKELKNIKVICDIVGEKKGEKLYSFKKKPKTGYKRGCGYRESLTVLKVAEITKK